MQKKLLTSVGLGVALLGSNLGITHAVNQAPIEIMVQKLYYENKEDVNYKQDAAVVSTSQLWSKSQHGDVGFTLYKVDSNLDQAVSPVKVAQEIQEAVDKGSKDLPYSAKVYKGQVVIDDKGVVTFPDVEVGANYVVVESLHSKKVDLTAKPVFLKVDAEKPANLKVYLKNNAPKPVDPTPEEPKPNEPKSEVPKENPPKGEEPKKVETPKQGNTSTGFGNKVSQYLASTGLSSNKVGIYGGISALLVGICIVVLRLRNRKKN